MGGTYTWHVAKSRVYGSIKHELIATLNFRMHAPYWKLFFIRIVSKWWYAGKLNFIMQHFKCTLHGSLHQAVYATEGNMLGHTRAR